MAGYTSYRLLRPSWRTSRLKSALYRSQPPRRLIITGIHSKNGPTQSECLRFALTREAHGNDLRQHLPMVIQADWPRDSSPAPLWTTHSRDTDSYFQDRENALSRMKDIHGLQSFLEGNVISSSGDAHTSRSIQEALRKALAQSERYNTHSEILAFLNGLETRFERLESKKDYYLHVLGMQYACLALSEPALKHHLNGYLSMRNKPLDLEHSHYLVQSLLSSLQNSTFQDPERDMSKFLRCVTGGPGSSGPSLHKILYWESSRMQTAEIGGYVSLLVHAKADKIRQTIWNLYLKRMESQSDPTLPDLQSAYEYAATLLDVGDSRGALTVLKRVSKQSKNDLPGISKCICLDTLIKNDFIRKTLSQLVSEKEYTAILEYELNEVEQRLGIKWEIEQGKHIALCDARDVSDQPILSINGDSPGYDSSERLIAEIRALGKSKAPADLNKIADILDEYAGNLIPVPVPFSAERETEYYWAPQRSPIALSSPLGLQDSRNPSISDTGLMKVTTAPGLEPFAFAPSLHLVQLGFLRTWKPVPFVRKSSPQAYTPVSDLETELAKAPDAIPEDHVDDQFERQHDERYRRGFDEQSEEEFEEHTVKHFRTPTEIPVEQHVQENENHSGNNIELHKQRPSDKIHYMGKNSSEHKEEPTEDDEKISEPAMYLGESGYLVTWDRVSGRFLMVFVGDQKQWLDPARVYQNVPADDGPDAISEIYPLGIDTAKPGPRISMPHYRLSLDPSPDLVFGEHT